MKIFVVSQYALAPKAQPGPGSLTSLIQQLACVDVADSNATSVVAVSDTYNLGAVTSIASDDIAAFVLDDFRDQRQQSVNDVVCIDSNVLATKLNRNTCSWVAIDFEQNLPVNSTDLIRKISRYAFMGRALQDKNLVLLVPPLYVGFYARSVNEAFNNLPVSSIEIARSGQTNMLFMSTTMERVILSLPLLTGPIRRLNHLLMHVYQRLVRPA
ncbi:TPA: hypothetical protein ACSPMB_002813 [Pseudomonas aeruginosa]